LAEVRLEGVSKRFGRIQAIWRLTFEVEDGQFAVILGPTGAGKTTTLRCVAGLERPDEGHIYFDGRCVDGLSPAERDVAFVFQSFALYPRLTVYENIASPLKARGMGRDEIERRVRWAAEVLRISHLLDRMPDQLSGGEMQRVALGRAIVREPNVFLLDEPLSNLDAKLREGMRTELKKLQTDLGATFLYATPDHAEALSMGDKIIVINEGRIHQIGTPQEIYDRPADTFVAYFVGSPGMNLLPCRIISEGDRLFADIGPGAFRVELPPEVKEGLEDATTLGIRAEEVEVSLREERGWLRGRISLVETLGGYNIVEVDLGGIAVKARTDFSFSPPPGAEVWVRFRRDKIRLFDREGRAIPSPAACKAPSNA